ncbi:hypothetical protein SAMN02745163_04400 [Clostridium cavendishii DSM 21758]|uniref:Lipoprotein n=1 Tax=Clostridium cavendishii DSM 21758 TaxID=1121302 RepID=A0A1M6V1E8_9CLOT|nr:hypothetical protein [Clostridium cavendishii]SHK75337.1 hypothetical protein SAMN02745163_04400 [Clostridium cavendishii DSM 21758]
MKKKMLIICLVLILITVLIGCSKDKNINVKEDIKKENSKKDSEKELYKNIGELKIDSKKDFQVLTFKDNENLILLKSTEENKYNHELYNYNLKSEKNVRLGDFGEIKSPNYIKRGKSGQIIHIKNNMVLIYDTAANEEKCIYYLDEVRKDFNKQKYKISDEEIAKRINVNWVNGSDKYITISEYLQFDGYHECITRLIDINDGKEYTTGFCKDEDTGIDWAYSKKTDMFYYSGDSKNIYEINPTKGIEAKRFLKLEGYDRQKGNINMSEDGKTLYVLEDDKDIQYIESIDIESKKISKILEYKRKKDNNWWAGISQFSLIDNLVIYTLNTSKSEDDFIKSYDEILIGNLNDDELKNVTKLNYVNRDNYPIAQYVQISKDKSKVVKTVQIVKDKESKDRDYKYFLYEKN